jgi:hypothetical protein
MKARSALIGLVLGLLSACTRPLTEGEAQFAQNIFGDSLDPSQVRVAQGFGLTPPPKPNPRPAVTKKREPRPGVCDRDQPGLEPGPPPAIAVYNRIHLMRPFYRADTAPGWPDSVMIPQTLIMAHELVHVWQWQNRAITGYRPIRAALESVFSSDPYFYVPSDGSYLDYGFEQQGSLVEDYLCFAIFDPDAPKRSDLRAILSLVFPVDRIDAALAP